MPSDPATTLLQATHNPAKLAEIKRLLDVTSYHIVSLADLGITFDVEETGVTFQENALLKAQAYCAMTGLITLADDSGLEVIALNGQPGIYTNRWAGEHATDEDKRQFLLKNMMNVSEGQRQAQFTVVMVLAWPSGKIFITSGYLKGSISVDVRGTPIPKFPYRSVFMPEGSTKTLAELIEQGTETLVSPDHQLISMVAKQVIGI